MHSSQHLPVWSNFWGYDLFFVKKGTISNPFELREQNWCWPVKKPNFFFLEFLSWKRSITRLSPCSAHIRWHRQNSPSSERRPFSMKLASHLKRFPRRVLSRHEPSSLFRSPKLRSFSESAFVGRFFFHLFVQFRTFQMSWQSESFDGIVKRFE